MNGGSREKIILVTREEEQDDDYSSLGEPDAAQTVSLSTKNFMFYHTIAQVDEKRPAKENNVHEI